MLGGPLTLDILDAAPFISNIYHILLVCPPANTL